MSERNGLNLAPIDFNTGVHLNAERDEFGLTKYWAVIEGDEITLLPHQYEALMNLAYYERKAEKESIIKLLEDRVSWLLNQDNFMQIAEAESWLRAIALIKESHRN